MEGSPSSTDTTAAGTDRGSGESGAEAPPAPRSPVRPAAPELHPLGDDRSPAAFAAFYRDTYERHVRLAYLILGCRDQAEEVVQEAYVRLHGRWSRVDRPAAYLRTAVVNASRDVIRRRIRWRRREAVLATPADATDEPDELFDALAHLNPRQRAVVVLRFYGGLQEAEIAEAVGMKVGTVKSTLHRSIEQLRKEIER